MGKKYMSQSMDTVLKQNVNTNTLYDRGGAAEYDSLGEVRAAASPKVYNWNYTAYAFTVLDDSKEIRIDDDPRFFPRVNTDAITGIGVCITDTRTGAQQVITMDIDKDTSYSDYAKFQKVFEQCAGYHGQRLDANLPANITVTPLIGEHHWDDMFLAQLQQQLGLDALRAEQFTRTFEQVYAINEDMPMYPRLMEAAHEALSATKTPTQCNLIITQAQQRLEAQLATESWSTQVTWQLSELPDKMAMTMREHVMGEAQLYQEQGIPVDQAHALALLKVVNKECYTEHVYGAHNNVPQLAALKERAAQMAVQAGCSKDAMLDATKDTITDPSNIDGVYQAVLKRAFQTTIERMNPVKHIAFSNAMRGISENMYMFDNTQKGKTPLEDMQARIGEQSAKIQSTFRFHRVEAPMIPESADIANEIARIAARGNCTWQEYMAQYLVNMPYELHQDFCNKAQTELQRLNLMGDGLSVANMATAAHHAIANMVRDESLTPGVRLHLAGLEGKALDQALEAGANPNEFADIDRDSHEDIGDDE